MSYYTRPETVPADLSTIDPLLRDLMTRCTPTKFEGYIAAIVKEHTKKYPYEEIEGNLIIKVGEGKLTTLFSSHMDMIGDIHKNNLEAGKLDLVYLMEPKDKKKKGFIYGSKGILENGKFLKYEACTIGADDKVGVFLMIKMIQDNIPGLYVFHVGEEVGGTGSKLLTTSHKEKFEGIQRAIAFDRAGLGDVIEHQRGGRCCSEKFGKALATALNEWMPPFQQYKGGITGTFTDTANYRDIVPECTNISVGYYNQHGSSEFFDNVWLMSILLPAVLNVKWDELPVERDPKAVTTYNNSVNYGRNYSSSANRKNWKEATKDTKYWELPIWEPKLGYMESNEGVLLKCIQNYVNNCFSTREKDEAGKCIYDLLELIEYYDIEVKLLKDMVDRQQKELRGEVVIIPPTKDTIIDMDIVKKKGFLVDLISVDDIYKLPQYEEIYTKYAKRSKNFLDQHKLHNRSEQYTAAELKRFNRTIYMMAYYLSLSTLINDSVEKLLNEIHEYIIMHMEEPGFDKEPEVVKNNNDVQQQAIDTGRSVAVH